MIDRVDFPRADADRTMSRVVEERIKTVLSHAVFAAIYAAG